MSRLLPCLLLATLAPAAWAAPPIPGGVLAPGGKTAYLATDGGIDAVDVDRGETRWRSRAAQVPLLTAGDRLYALALSPRNELHVCGLDIAGKGERVFLSDPIELPGWVVTAEAPGHRFACTWRLERNVLRLSWQASAWAGTGSRKEAAGTVVVDLDRGKVEVSPPTTPRPAAVAAPPPQLERHSVRWHRRLGGHLLAVVAEDLPESKPGARRQRLMLCGWDERGRADTPRELLRGSQLVVLPGLDGSHLWLRDAEAVAGRQAAPWQVVSPVGGHVVAVVPFVPGTRAATLIGRRAYCLAAAPVRNTFDGPTRRAQVLSAIDVECGKVLWRHTLTSRPLPRLGD